MFTCLQLAASAYLYRHNLVAGVIHWHLSKGFSLPLSMSSWFHHHPSPVIENSLAKILRDFSLTLEFHHLSNRPDSVVFDYEKKNIVCRDILPYQHQRTTKEKEKLTKYWPLAHDFRRKYKMPVDIIPVVIGYSGVMSVQCQEYLEHLPDFSNRVLCHLQKAALLGTIHILHTLNF